MTWSDSSGAVSAGAWIVTPRPAANRRLSFLVAGAVFVVALALLAFVSSRPSASGERPSSAEAVRAALAKPDIRRYLERSGYTRTRTIPLDDELMRVSFFDGPRIVLDAAVAKHGEVLHKLEYGPRYVRAGNPTIQTPLALLVFSAVFALALACVPLRRMQNLDVLALLSFALPIVLLNKRLFELSVYASYPPLVYLCLRCLRVASGRPTASAKPARPLYVALTPRWSDPRRLRLLWIALPAAALALVFASTAGGLVDDVGFASIAGATKLLDGTLPYGHLPAELVHGDTYPLLAYALYIPAALLMPVRDAFDNLDGALMVAAAASLAAAAAIYITSARVSDNSRLTGLLHALAWLAFPPVLIGASSGSNDLVAAACIAVAFATAGYAARSSALLVVAGWVKLIPLFLLPLMIARSRSRIRAAVVAAASITFAVLVWIVIIGGTGGVFDMLGAVSFQSERGSLLSVWTLLEAKPFQLAFQAAAFALVGLATIELWRDRELSNDIRRFAALSAGAMLAFQLGANYWTYAYLPWVLPCIFLALFPGDRASGAR